MNRQYPIESLLLSRSYDSNEKILDLLQSRYTVNDRPPQLNLNPTTSTRAPTGKISILKTIKNLKDLNSDKTRLVFKRYIKSCMRNQRLLKRTLRSYKDKTKGMESLIKTKKFKNIPKYEDFLNLNALWIGYVQDLLQIDTIQSTLNNTQQQQILNKLASADFNGCFLQVLKSSDTNIVGKSGIVIWDSKNFFIVVQDSNIDTLKLIPKKNTIFNFLIPLFKIDQEDEDQKKDEEYLEFSIIGSRFQFKASDRSGKKFKSRNVDDLNL